MGPLGVGRRLEPYLKATNFSVPGPDCRFITLVAAVWIIMSNPEEASDLPLRGNGNVAAQSVSRPVFMPETFTGSGREWSDWIAQFEVAAEVNGWDDSLKMKFLSLLLSGRARELYSGLPSASRNTYSNLKEALGRCLEPCDSDDWNRANFFISQAVSK